MLTNITYAGHLCQGKDKITALNTHEAIVEQSLFDEVQAILQNNTINPSKTPTSENLFRGKVICGCCGNKMQRRKGSGNVDWYYFTFITTEPRIKKMSAEKQEFCRQIFMLELEDARSRVLRKSYYEQFCDGYVSKEDFRIKADNLIYHTEEIVKLDKEVKALDTLREKDNFYIKVKESKISIREFIGGIQINWLYLKT